jgi:hypothetical protein
MKLTDDQKVLIFFAIVGLTIGLVTGWFMR